MDLPFVHTTMAHGSYLSISSPITSGLVIRNGSVAQPLLAEHRNEHSEETGVRHGSSLDDHACRTRGLPWDWRKILDESVVVHLDASMRLRA